LAELAALREEIKYLREGAAAGLNGKPITAAVLAGFMRRYSDSVNMVNAPFLAKERGLDVSEIRHEREGAFNTLIRVTVETAAGPRSVVSDARGRELHRGTRWGTDDGVRTHARYAGQCPFGADRFVGLPH
jgi:hypothetical protein